MHGSSGILFDHLVGAQQERPANSKFVEPLHRKVHPDGFSITHGSDEEMKRRAVHTNRPPRISQTVMPYLACAAIAFSICALTASRLKLAPFCIGGYSIAVWATLAISFCTNWKRQNS